MTTKRLIGTDLDQIPRNKDLGVNAYIDSDYAVFNNTYIKNAELTGVASGETYNSNTPIASPTLWCDFAKTKTLDSRITFQRDSIATYMDADGLIKTAQAFQPRFEHDSQTGVCKGLLIEEERTNLLGKSLEYYIPGGSSRFTVSSTYPAPDGSTKGNKFTTNPSGQVGALYTACYALGYNVISYSAGTTYTFSMYVKVLDATVVKWRPMIHAGLFSDNINRYALIDVATGVVEDKSSDVTATSTYIKDGWWRLTITGTPDLSTTNNFPCYLYLYDSLGASLMNESYATATDLLAVWGNQVEVGAFATSYIPTTLGAVTRKADVAYVGGTDFAKLYNPNEGTLVGYAYNKNGTPGYSGNRTEQFYGLSSGAINRVFFTCNNGNGNIITLQKDSVQSSYVTKTFTQNVPFKHAISFASSSASCAYNGNFYGSKTVSSPPDYTLMNKISIGSAYDSANGFWNSTIAYVAYYPKALTPAELQELTYL